MPKPPSQESLNKLAGVKVGTAVQLLLCGFAGNGAKGPVVVPPVMLSVNWVAIDATDPTNPWLTFSDERGCQHGATWDQICGMQIATGDDESPQHTGE